MPSSEQQIIRIVSARAFPGIPTRSLHRPKYAAPRRHRASMETRNKREIELRGCQRMSVGVGIDVTNENSLEECFCARVIIGTVHICTMAQDR